MKKIVLLMIGAAALFVTAGCEEEHEHHHHAGGAYDGTYHEYGHDQWRGYPAEPGYHHDDDWHPH